MKTHCICLFSLRWLFIFCKHFVDYIRPLDSSATFWTASLAGRITIAEADKTLIPKGVKSDGEVTEYETARFDGAYILISGSAGFNVVRGQKGLIYTEGKKAATVNDIDSHAKGINNRHTDKSIKGSMLEDSAVTPEKLDRSYLPSSVYDPQGRTMDIFQYVDDSIGVLNAALQARLEGII